MAPDERRVLTDLRRSRRRRRTADFDVFEAIYRAYITGVVSTIVIWLLSGVVGDTRANAAAVARVDAHGAAVVGIVVGVAFAIGCRSGGRGGPLVIEAADVRHVLLSPVDRNVALRPPAWRQLRFGGSVGAAVGAAAGLLAYRRLPGDPLAWIVSGAFTGAFASAGSLGLAMIVSGRRLGSRVGTLLALLVAGWSVADYFGHTTTSPATDLGVLALWPLQFRPIGFIGPVVAVAAVVVGLALVGGASIEAAERRATLVGQIRFAATLRDLRTVVVLRRQLAQELPRQRPWIRLARTLPAPPPRIAPGQPPAGAPSRRDTVKPRWFPVWRRGWHGILRFPGLRLARLAVLGAVAGAALVGVWRGTTPLLLVAALALYVAALDAVEPLSQELDHPDRRDGYVVEEGVLFLRAVGPSVVLMIVVALFGWVTAVALTVGSALAVQVGGLMLVPAALCGVGAACISVIQGPPPVFSSTDSMLPPEMAGVRALLRTVIPPLVALVGVLPVLAGRSPPARQSAVAGTGAVLPFVIVLVLVVGGWIRYRQAGAAWWRKSMEEAASARQPGGFKGPPAR
jgi:hypothetical protein